MKVLDRTALNRSRLRFARLSDHIRAILDTIREPFVVLDESLRIRLVNKSFCKMCRCSPKTIHGKSIDSLGIVAWQTPAVRNWLGTILAKHCDIPDLEVSGTLPPIGHRTMLFNVRQVVIPGARRIHLLTIDDVTERREAEQAAEKLNASLKSDSMTDKLTGLYNRRGYDVLSQHYLDLAHRRGKRIFVIYADMDGLKQLNDQAGHSGGDQALVRVADILRKTFRKSDIIARIGGDEFAIVTIENGHDSAEIQAGRLQSNLRRHAVQHNNVLPISLSVGVARSNPLGTSSIQDLTAHADHLMYLAKQNKQKSEIVASDPIANGGGLGDAGSSTAAMLH